MFREMRPRTIIGVAIILTDGTAFSASLYGGCQDGGMETILGVPYQETDALGVLTSAERNSIVSRSRTVTKAGVSPSKSSWENRSRSTPDLATSVDT